MGVLRALVIGLRGEAATDGGEGNVAAEAGLRMRQGALKVASNKWSGVKVPAKGGLVGCCCLLKGHKEKCFVPTDRRSVDRNGGERGRERVTLPQGRIKSHMHYSTPVVA